MGADGTICIYGITMTITYIFLYLTIFMNINHLIHYTGKSRS
jgi:hypothetical protein